MAQDNRFYPARLERLERRLQVLEDEEAIRKLKARYAALCDNQYDAGGIASLFTKDAVWESPALGRFEGREAIPHFFPRRVEYLLLCDPLPDGAALRRQRLPLFGRSHCCRSPTV